MGGGLVRCCPAMPKPPGQPWLGTPLLSFQGCESMSLPFVRLDHRQFRAFGD